MTAVIPRPGVARRERPGPDTPNAPYWKIAQPLWDYMEATGATPMVLCEKLYGRDSTGKVNGVGTLYPVINGTLRPGAKTRRRIYEGLGIDLAPLCEANKELPQRAYNAVQTFNAMKLDELPPQPAKAQTIHAKPEPMPPPRFAMTIGQNGRSNVTFNLVDASAETAMQAYAVLSSAGLLAPA